MWWFLPFLLTIMPNPSIPPPIRVRNPSGTFNQTPVFELEVSGGTLTQISPIRTRLLMDSGGAGSTIVYAATGDQYVTISAAADLTDEYIIRGSTGISLTSASNVLFVHYGSLLVTTSRAINATAPLAGGGDLSADRILTADTAALVTSGRTITAVFPISGGGDLSANRTLIVDTAFLVTSSRQVIAGSGLSGTGNFGGDVTLSVNTNVRDKAIGFFFAGALATTSLAINARAYIPFNMQLLQVRLASQAAPTGESVIINPRQYNATLGASTALFAATNRPIIVSGANVGSDNTTFAIGNLYTGSWLGLDIDQVGTTNAGSNLTVTFVVRNS